MTTLGNKYFVLSSKSGIKRSIHGDYGVTVNTEVCGTFDSGSIPDSRPKIRLAEMFKLTGVESQVAEYFCWRRLLSVLTSFASCEH